MLLAFGASYIPSLIGEKYLDSKYDSYVEERTVSEGDVGGPATDDTPRAESVDDLLNNDTFTIVSERSKYLNDGGGYYGSYYMHTVTLPSGERIAAVINGDAVKRTGDSIYGSDAILPVGKIVYEDLSDSENFLNQIEYRDKLSRHDLYIDMLGNGGKMDEETYKSTSLMWIQIAVFIVVFAVVHSLGSRLGIFPYFFAPKNDKSEWD